MGLTLGGLLLVSGAVRAEDGENSAAVTFGPEFTFTSKLLLAESLLGFGAIPDLPFSRLAKRRMADWIRRNCRGCTVEAVKSTKGEHRSTFLERLYHSRITHYVVRYPNGFWFKILPDPGVVEVIAKPSTRAEFLAMKDTLAHDLFGAARAVGLRPMDIAGAGHVNMGVVGAFGDNARLFRNFLVDMVNNPEFNEQMGSGGRAVHNLPDRAKAEFVRAISDFDKGRIKTIAGLAKRIREKVYPGGRIGRYVTLALHYIGPKGRFGEAQPPEAQRLELRGIRAQYDMDEFLLETELLEAKLRQLEKLEGFLPLEIPSANRTDEQKRERFRKWVTDAGLNPERFAALAVPAPPYQNSFPLLCIHALGIVAQ